MNDVASVAVACEMHRRIVDRIRAVWANKVEVYRLLAEFTRRRLYRLLDLPIARRHAANICAGRRFSTWGDYLSGLGGGGTAARESGAPPRRHRRPAPAASADAPGGRSGPTALPPSRRSTSRRSGVHTSSPEDDPADSYTPSCPSSATPLWNRRSLQDIFTLHPSDIITLLLQGVVVS